MNSKTSLRVAGTFIAIAAVAALFQNCNQAMKPANYGDGDLGAQAGSITSPSTSPSPTGSPAPGPAPAPAPAPAPGPKDLSKATWRTISKVGAPTETFCPTAVWTGSKVLVIGGATVGIPVHSYDPATDTWAQLPSNYTFMYGGGSYERHSTSSVYLNGKVYQHAGYHTAGACTGPYGCFYSESFAYDPVVGSWTYIGMFPGNYCRWGQTSVYDGVEFLLFGGAAPNGALAQNYSHNPVNNVFTALASAPQSRNQAAAAMVSPNLMMVWGGSELAEHPNYRVAATGFNTSLFYNRTTNTWAAGTDVSPLAARQSTANAFTGTQFAIWGGRMGTTYFSDGAVYEPASNSWKLLPTTGAPSARECAAAVWTGDGFFVWGGAKDGVMVTDGFMLK